MEFRGTGTESPLFPPQLTPPDEIMMRETRKTYYTGYIQYSTC
jgi:hypothetical protein